MAFAPVSNGEVALDIIRRLLALTLIRRDLGGKSRARRILFGLLPASERVAHLPELPMSRRISRRLLCRGSQELGPLVALSVNLPLQGRLHRFRRRDALCRIRWCQKAAEGWLRGKSRGLQQQM